MTTDFTKTPHHLITIKVPVPANSAHGANKVIAGYGNELEALTAKLPEGSFCEDRVMNPRTGSGERTPRKTTEEKIAEAVAEAVAKDRASRGPGRAAA